ncbi:caspase domain-containing protein [Biscogniauxia marginata]|nr:caspase domain-containing protein [Biscogniauxia marginata]
MTNKDFTSTLWAIIIGINYYPSDRCLQGSVQDAMMVKHYLEEGAIPIDTAILTATTPSDPTSGQPVEEPEIWPTQKNVVSNLKRIIKMANPGDSVYIHYSGHGTRIPSDARPGSDGTRGLALALFDRYLEGRHLATALRKMAEKGLIVTLVLDCCFSGDVVRGDDCRDWDVRCVGYNPKVNAVSFRVPEDDLFNSEHTLRNSEIKEDWLVNPDGYAIISACGPYERAYEINIEGQGRRGALTYFLFETLRRLGANGAKVSHRSLHEYLCAKFHSSWPQQTPMDFGNKNRSLWGHLIGTPETPFVSVYRAGDTRLCLRAGEAHGIHKGDEFAVSPFDVSEWATKQVKEPVKILRVETVRSFESDLIDTSPRSDTRDIATGWKAKLVKCASPRRTSVQLATHIHNQSQWKDAAKGRHFLHLSTEDASEPSMFNIIINENEEYEVVDVLHDKIAGLPMVPVGSPGAMAEILDIAHHLATFKYFEGVENRLPYPAFQQSFSLKPHSTTGANGAFEIEHDGIWGFTVDNTRNEPLYMAILNFTPSWEVVNLVTSSGGDGYQVVTPRKGEINGKKVIRLRMKVPDFLQASGIAQCQDIIKIFITSRPVSFPTMVLPKMPLDVDRPGRQPRCNTDDFLAILEQLPSQLRDSSNLRGEEWSTQNFIVQTTLKQRG